MAIYEAVDAIRPDLRLLERLLWADAKNVDALLKMTKKDGRAVYEHEPQIFGKERVAPKLRELQGVYENCVKTLEGIAANVTLLKDAREDIEILNVLSGIHAIVPQLIGEQSFLKAVRAAEEALGGEIKATHAAFCQLPNPTSRKVWKAHVEYNNALKRLPQLRYGPGSYKDGLVRVGGVAAQVKKDTEKEAVEAFAAAAQKTDMVTLYELTRKWRETGSLE